MIAETILPGRAPYFLNWKMKGHADWDKVLISEIVENPSRAFAGRDLSSNSVAQVVCWLFRQIGTHRAKYRPSFYAVFHRMLNGKPFPCVHPSMDFSSLILFRWEVPCCAPPGRTMQ